MDSYNKLPKRKTIEDAEYIKNKLQPTDKELKERDRLIKAVDDTYKKSEELIKLNTIQKQDQKKYNEQYNALVEESNKLNEKLKAIENKIRDKESRVSVLTEYINTLKMSKRPLTDFDEGLFAALFDKMIVKEYLISEFCKICFAKRTLRIPNKNTVGVLNKDKVQVVWRAGSTMEVLK